ncbi:MAG TPA: DUF3857 domain-containing protein [Candidatus Acidoferrum sp.]|nr:DUF3857 domain-containing protein [Candidatus Acidoferrum sp.]
MKLCCIIPIALQSAVTIFLLLALRPGVAHAQDAAQKPEEKAANKQTEKPPAVEGTENPAQIELLETRIRFEHDGGSRKEVHARVKINNELGARQFARLNFDYNRAFESIDVPLVRITHASGGTADILPSAITDQPNPAVVNAPAYQDVRVKTVRILGLEPGDLLEYRVVTTVSHHPLVSDFSLDHSFDRTGVVSQEVFQVDLPASRAPSGPVVVKNEQMRVALQSRLFAVPLVWTTQPPDIMKPTPLPALSSSDQGSPGVHLFVKASAPAPSIERSGKGEDARVLYAWHRTTPNKESDRSDNSPAPEDMADVEFGISPSGWGLSHALYAALLLPDPLPEEITELARQLTQGAETSVEKTERIYDFVSKKILTIDLPLGATGFRRRPVGEILSSGYAIPEDKFFLFQALAKASNLHANAVLIGSSKKIATLVVGPASFSHLVVWVTDCDAWLDPSLEVAPFRALPASYLGSSALFVGPFSEAWDVRSLVWTQIPKNLPFTSSQKVSVDASLDSDGKLTARVRYTLRGDNELLLRIAFHHNPKEKWKDLAQLLSLSDGFRGQVTSVSASDPSATREPFTVEYDIAQPKFVDWSKKPVRIPALLPHLGLPDPPATQALGAPVSPLNLGTPLDVETRATLHLPANTAARTPTGISVERDYATFASRYAVHDLTLSAARHLQFLLREIPAARAADYNAFLRVIQNDETQDFTLERAETVSPKTDSAAPNKAAPPKPTPAKP